MKVLCKNKWRISTITKRNDEYYFFTNGIEVYHLKCNEAKSWIPEVPANALPWEYPVLRIEVLENGEYYQTTLDDRIIHAYRCLNQTSLQEFTAHYPENPDLEKEINMLPILYRPGLKALLYGKLKKTTYKRYMSMLVWLNKAAATVYKRYNSVDLSQPAIWYSANNDWEEIKTAGIASVIKSQANMKLKFMTVEEYLEQLGIREWSDLTESEIEVATELVCYMIKVNTSIAEDQNQIWKQPEYPLQLSKSEIHKVYLNTGAAKTWKNQDLLSLGKLTEQDMTDFWEIYQI